MTTTSSASRLSSQEQAQLIYQILSDVYDKSPWTIEQVVAVLKAYQGRGYASQLMKHLEDRSEPIFLEVRTSNQAAQALYKKFGFESLGIRKNYYHEPQEDAVIMRREEV